MQFSAKIFLGVTFVMTMVMQLAYGQFDDEEDDYFATRPQCSSQYLAYYSQCRGSLDACSTCLANAERECDKASNKSGICYYCTGQVAGNCDNIKPMCFGNQECGNPNYKCIDYECVYQSPSK